MQLAMAYRIADYDELVQKCIDTYAVFYGGVQFVVCGEIMEVYVKDGAK